MKKLIILSLAALIAACSDKCSTVVDGVETSSECEAEDVVVDTGSETVAE